MQLETYISDLLYRYDCVIVPNFGAFLTQRVSAKVHDTTHAFYPPKKVLSFNEQIKNNDGLLAHYIADVEKIPFEVAVQKIEKQVTYLKSELVIGKLLSFKNIGNIKNNGEGKMVFEPSYHLNYLTDAFGLSQFVSPCVSRAEDVFTLHQESTEIEKTVKPVISTVQEKVTETKKSKPYLRYAAIVTIGLTVAGFTSSNYYKNQIESQNQLAQKEATKQLESKIQEATFIIDNPLPAATLTIEKQNGNYHIIAGAFRVKENSDKKVEELRALGYRAHDIGVNKYGLHQVVYQSYNTREEAVEALEGIRKSSNRDAWLLVKALD